MIAKTAERNRRPADQKHGHRSAAILCQRPALLVLPRLAMDCWPWIRQGKSLVPGGDNRYHAILGNDGPAFFVSPSTLAPLFIALRATVRLAGPSGKREVPLEKFYLIPKSDD